MGESVDVEPSPGRVSDGWPIAGQIVAALTRRDFTDLGACLDPDVHLRAVLPLAVLDLTSAGAVAERFERWFGGPDQFEVVDASVGVIGPRHYVRWRVRMWPAGQPDRSRIVEQHAFTRGTDRIVALDLLCSGFTTDDGAR